MDSSFLGLSSNFSPSHTSLCLQSQDAFLISHSIIRHNKSVQVTSHEKLFPAHDFLKVSTLPIASNQFHAIYEVEVKLNARQIKMPEC